MSRRRQLFLLLWIGVAAGSLGAFGCGGSVDAFRPTYPDNQEAALTNVASRLASAAPSSDRGVVVGLTEDRLYAWDLAAGRRLWEQPVNDPHTAPHIAGDLVVIHEADRVVARRLADGGRAFDVADDRFSLVGAAGEGSLAAIVLSSTGGVGAESRLLIARAGGVVSRVDVEGSMGFPAVRAGLVFVPWGNQNVSVIDPDTGAEIARVRSLAGVVGHARANASGVYFGQTGVGRLSAAVSTGTAEQVGWVQPATTGLPGQPPLWRNAYDPPAGPRSAEHKIRIAWEPAPGEGAVGFTDDTLYMVFYRLVFGLAPDDLSVRWVHEHPADVVGAAAREGGVLLADAAGGLAFLGADGRPRWTADTGMHPTVAAIRLGDFTPSGSPEGAASSLADQLLSAVQNTDSRLVPGRAFAVQALGANPDSEVTTRLIVLCDDRSLPDQIRRAACETLGSREVGADVVLAALQRHASFLEGTGGPPVGALATVAARMGERRAVPLLVAHLRDPDTEVSDLPAVAAALGALGDQGAAGPLRDFLWLYHAEDDPALPPAIQAVARALVTLAGPPGRDDVQEVIDAPFTAPTTSGLLRELLTQLAAQAAGGQPSGASQAD